MGLVAENKKKMKDTVPTLNPNGENVVKGFNEEPPR